MSYKNKSRRTSINAVPTMLGAYKVWIDRDNRSVPQVWVHVSPWQTATIYHKGTALLDGTQRENEEFLLSISRAAIEDAIKKLTKPQREALERLWQEDVAERDVDNSYYAARLAELELQEDAADEKMLAALIDEESR